MVACFQLSELVLALVTVYTLFTLYFWVMKNQYICGCIYTQSKKYIKVRTQRDLLFDFDWKKRGVIIYKGISCLVGTVEERERI